MISRWCPTVLAAVSPRVVEAEPWLHPHCRPQSRRSRIKAGKRCHRLRHGCGQAIPLQAHCVFHRLDFQSTVKPHEQFRTDPLPELPGRTSVPRRCPAEGGCNEAALAHLEAGCGQRWGVDLSDCHIHLTGVDVDAAALKIRIAKHDDLDEAIVGDLFTIDLPPEIL